MKRKVRIGRPPRTDSPEPITLLLPGRLKRWLRGQATREQRNMADIVVAGLALYRRRVARKTAHHDTR